jgi:CarD family transcriptional regulator
MFAGRPQAAGAFRDYRRKEGVSLYKVGDKVVYPHHGAGTVVKREKREVLGEKREYLTIKILHNDMTVNVPADNAERVGLRKVIDEEAVKKVVKYLTSGGTEMPKNWNRRFKHNRDKMKTGDIFELAEVVRNLALRDGEKGLSTGEKQMYVKAKKILASELMYAKNMSEDEAIEWLEGVLTGAIKEPTTPARKPAAPKAPAAKAAPAKKPVARAAAAKPAAKSSSKPRATTVAKSTRTSSKSAPAKKTAASAAKKAPAKKSAATPAAKKKARAAA